MHKKFFLLSWPLKKVIYLGIILFVLSVLSIFFVDHRLTQYIHNTYGVSLDQPANIITRLGLADVYFWIGSIGFIFCFIIEKYLFYTLKLEKTNLSSILKWKTNFKFMFYTFLYSGIILVVLKMIFGRCRPYNSPTFDALLFKPFTLDWNFQSYPSGHTQVSFTMACFMSYLWPKFTTLFFTIAVLIASTRIILQYHYLGDTLIGSYIGILGFYLSHKSFFKS